MGPTITPHQLELFYYVAKHGGISSASRHIPYGIGQPAISGQMTDLERRLGVSLFGRKPFQLTTHGQMIYGHLGPFFDGLEPLWEQLRNEPTSSVHIAADNLIGQEFFPALIAAVLPPSAPEHLPTPALMPLPPKALPPLSSSALAHLPSPTAGFEFWSGSPASIAAGLHERRVHLAITTTNHHIRHVRSITLARPGLQLLVPRKTNIKSPGHFWQQRHITERLICPRDAGLVNQTFTRGLEALRVKWPAHIRVDSPTVMLSLVANGHGIGLSLELPSQRQHPDVRVLPLTTFERVPLVALWRPPASLRLESLLVATRDTARKLWPAATLPVPEPSKGCWNHRLVMPLRSVTTD